MLSQQWEPNGNGKCKKGGSIGGKGGGGRQLDPYHLQVLECPPTRISIKKIKLNYSTFKCRYLVGRWCTLQQIIQNPATSSIINKQFKIFCQHKDINCVDQNSIQSVYDLELQYMILVYGFIC